MWCVVCFRPFHRGAISPRGGHDFRQGRFGQGPRPLWGKPANPPDEHWSKYDPGTQDSSDEEEQRTKYVRKRISGRSVSPSDDYMRGREDRFAASPRKNVSPRRPPSLKDEGDIEEPYMDPRSDRVRSRSPMKRSISKSPGRSNSPHMMTLSPEEGEIGGQHRSPGEATPSPPAKRLRGPSTEMRPGPPPPMAMRGHPPSPDMLPMQVRPLEGHSGRGRPPGLPPPGQMRRPHPASPPQPQLAERMTRATRKRSEEEMLPPSKRLRNMNRM